MEYIGFSISKLSNNSCEKCDLAYFFLKLKKDSNFEEFLAVHQKRCKVPTWTNDTLSGKKEEARKVDDYLNFDSDDSEELSEEDDIKGTKGKHL